jgi:hypothetical protein
MSGSHRRAVADLPHARAKVRRCCRCPPQGGLARLDEEHDRRRGVVGRRYDELNLDESSPSSSECPRRPLFVVRTSRHDALKKDTSAQVSEPPTPSDPTAVTISAPAKRPPGRPKIGQGPVIPWLEVDALIVQGEAITGAGPGERRYPSLRELAQRFGVSQTRIWQYTQKHKCFERRKEMSLRTQARTDQILAEKVAGERAIATTDLVRIVDQYLLGFEKELRDGHVKTDSAADFDRLARLRELLVGGVDSRTELTGTLTLEAIQQRHRQLRDQAAGMTPALTGTAAPQAGGDDRDDGTTLQLAHGAINTEGPAPARRGRTAPAEANTAAASGATEAAAPDREPPRIEVDVDAVAAKSAEAAGTSDRADDLPRWFAAPDADDLPPELPDDDDLVAERADFGAELVSGEEA